MSHRRTRYEADDVDDDNNHGEEEAAQYQLVRPRAPPPTQTRTLAEDPFAIRPARARGMPTVTEDDLLTDTIITLQAEERTRAIQRVQARYLWILQKKIDTLLREYNYNNHPGAIAFREKHEGLACLPKHLQAETRLAEAHAQGELVAGLAAQQPPPFPLGLLQLGGPRGPLPPSHPGTQHPPPHAAPPLAAPRLAAAPLLLAAAPLLLAAPPLTAPRLAAAPPPLAAPPLAAVPPPLATAAHLHHAAVHIGLLNDGDIVSGLAPPPPGPIGSVDSGPAYIVIEPE
ncbi:hypothetical protein DFJ77DRAFT_543958 [Powellomyces hirtus]|nr:hypothetical protein DFJ77DRAFT_543958 [Powellomyces hirtus]